MRIVLTLLGAFAASVLAMRLLIPALRALKAGQSIREIGPNWHKDKEGTPTMGGLGFIAATILAVLIAGWLLHYLLRKIYQIFFRRFRSFKT